MALGKDTFCRGIDVYNLCDTEETSVSVTTYVGHSMSTGPKVAIRRNRPFEVDGDESCVCRHKPLSVNTVGNTPTSISNHVQGTVIGTIDASIYRKNSNQDNSKYIIRKTKRNSKMDNESPSEIIEKAIGKGKDVIGIINLSEALLRIVETGTLTIEETLEALRSLRDTLLKGDGEGYSSMAEAIKDINADAPHQQDQLNCQDEAARTLAASTHGAASHLTKTGVEGEDEQGDEMCIVRRLTPTETSRLQGFPDDYTKIDGPETADAPQFKSHGNSWATNCANFVSARMDMELRRLGHEGTIRYATCCSGIEAHSVAVRNLDWKAIFFSEIEPFPCRVLEKHYPDVPNLGDMTQIHFDADKGMITNETEEGYSLPKEFLKAQIQSIPYKVGGLEVFSGGTPCQSISVAGKREGMAEGSGTRSSLAFHYQRIIDECRPMFTIWENVPGAFSSNGGADFIWFVNRCAESGYAMAWRVLDAQYTMTEEFPRAVPQRRRRIWLVGYRENDWRIPSRIVFETVKALTDNPPDRIPGLGFKSLNTDVDIEAIRNENKKQEETKKDEGFLDLFSGIEDDSPKAKKVSQMIPLDDMPSESDFSKMTMVDIYEFAKRVGEPGYLGPVFRKDKKTAGYMLTDEEREKLNEDNDPEVRAKYEKLLEMEKNGELLWEGAEKVSPQILENIGNAGILSNGRVLTMNCHEWTSGIQLSPKTYSAWEVVMQYKDWLKANDLLPEAYDETVCGLSDVLEENPDEKYNLSWRACFGILRRAETRGKELPTALYIALISTIRENAPIVKWVVLNGKDTKKKETDLSEKESAKVCFERYISPVLNFDEVVPMPPKRKNGDESDIDEDYGEDIDVELDEDGNVIDTEGFGPIHDTAKEIEKDAVPEMPNGCINESGGETAPTIVASQYKGPGNTQDATVVAVKKEIRNQE